MIHTRAVARALEMLDRPGRQAEKRFRVAEEHAEPEWCRAAACCNRAWGSSCAWFQPSVRHTWNQSGVPWFELYYGGNYKKLQEAKRRWDPHQVFNHVLSVEPG